MTAAAPDVAVTAPGYVPGHVMRITAPPSNPRAPWWPRPSCSCGWDGDEQPDVDGARDAHADHVAGVP